MINYIRKYTSDLIFLGLFVGIIILTRTTFHIGNNIEFITVLGTLAMISFKSKKIAVLVPLLSIFLTDMFIGNAAIFVFTWTGFLMVPLLSLWYNREDRNKHNVMKNLGVDQLLVPAVSSTLFFFLWTNFGVVLVSTMYQKNSIGVLESYYMGIPFLRNQLIGNIVISLAIWLLIKLYYKGKSALDHYYTYGNLHKIWR